MKKKNPPPLLFGFFQLQGHAVAKHCGKGTGDWGGGGGGGGGGSGGGGGGGGGGKKKFRGVGCSPPKKKKKERIKTCVMRKHVVCNYWKSSTTENNN